jgi:hypothetical protein
MAHHLSVFAENKPGTLEKLTRVLAGASVDIRAISVSSAGSFGIVKVLVPDPVRAAELLKKNGVTAAVRSIIAAMVTDEPGGFHALLSLLSAKGVNIEDCYGFVIQNRKEAVIVLEAEKYPEAEKILSAAGVRILSDAEIYSL